MRKRKELYPGTGDAEREKVRAARRGYPPGLFFTIPPGTSPGAFF